MEAWTRGLDTSIRSASGLRTEGNKGSVSSLWPVGLDWNSATDKSPAVSLRKRHSFSRVLPAQAEKIEQ
jgi:hypothetical protein